MITATPSRRSAILLSLLLLPIFICVDPAQAATAVVTQIDPFSATPTPGSWYENDIRGAGVASIESLVGLGGALENDAPLPTGAVRLTTGADNNDKAEIGVADDFGLAGDIIDGNLQLSYSYYKESSGNAFAAPSIKLVFFNFEQPCPSPDADCFVTLVYEPTWNQPGTEGSSAAVPTGAWTNVSIANTSGLFWGTGGFGLPNTAGGPPLRTLDEWLTASDASFQNATLVTVSVGVGTYNQDQIGYFDDVSLVTTGPSPVDVTYDFETPAPAPFGLFVDLFDSSQGVSPVQAGYVAVDADDASDGSPVAVNGIDVSLASAGVETNGTGVNGRDRGALDVSQPLSDLARDFAFAFGEDLELTLDGLAPGIYEWTGYFHDRTVDQGVSTLSLSVDGGLTFPYGPDEVANSTGTNPASIATDRIRFLTDGTAPVVIRISNPDLPTPSVRPILDGFDVEASSALKGVFVDWFDSGQGASPVQAGYVGADAADASDGTPIVVDGLALSLASEGTEVGGTGVDGRDRGALDASQPLSDLARDFAFALGEDLVLSIDNVQQGTYVWTGYFHDSNVDQGEAEVSLSVDGGSTFPFGPYPYFHSTGTNPPSIATQSIVFETDGKSPVVVRISNPDLPAPSVRPILDGFDFQLLEASRLAVDLFDSSQGVSPVQTGFVGVDATDASDGSPVDLGLARISLASGGVETDGTGLSGRDRGALAPGQNSSDLARDFAFAWGEDLLLTIEGLAADDYVWTGMFHDSNLDQGEAEVSLSVDGGVTFPIGPIAFFHSTGTDPDPLSIVSVTLQANGVDPVVVRISNSDLPVPSVRPILNGFTVQVPEPGFWISFLSGLGLLTVLHRRRRR